MIKRIKKILFMLIFGTDKIQFILDYTLIMFMLGQESSIQRKGSMT